VSPLGLLLPRASIQGLFGLLDNRGECRGLGGGEIREYLAVQVYLGESEAVDELRVREAMLAGTSVDPLYPERPEVPLALLAPGVGVDPALPDLLLGPLVRALLRPR
jgi:hypothetical protein